MEAEQIVSLILGIFTLIGVLGAAYLAKDSNKKVEKIRVATTVNHHESEIPTLVDRLDTIQEIQSSVQMDLATLTGKIGAQNEEQQRRNDIQDARLAKGMIRFERIETSLENHRKICEHESR